MFLYTVLAAVAAIVAGIILAARTKKAEGVIYGKLDKAGRITNILLLIGYVLCAPFYMFLGMISVSGQEGFFGIVGWILCVIVASASLFCGLGLGFSVALRKKGKSAASFAVQFAGLVGIGLTFLLYAALEGNLIRPLNF